MTDQKIGAFFYQRLTLCGQHCFGGAAQADGNEAAGYCELTPLDFAPGTVDFLLNAFPAANDPTPAGQAAATSVSTAGCP